MIDTFVEVKLKESGDFLKVKETLTRIGVPNYADEKPTLYQSCHILHKQGKFYIVHFKELFALDAESRRLRGLKEFGVRTEFSEEDKGRRNRIAEMLSSWGLVELVNPDIIKEPKAPKDFIRVLPYREKAAWNLVPKYEMGRKLNGRRKQDD